MPVRSAGILLHRDIGAGLEVLLVHPGGPLWARRDRGAWSIPKGVLTPEEDSLDAARREFAEELGVAPPEGEAIDLGEVRQRSGKRVRAFALAGDPQPFFTESNTFEMEWPPRSGRRQSFAEVDRAQWFALAEARERLLPAQAPFLDRLTSLRQSRK
ncbi:MAG TPA: NUDIX domain-containing protein [Solirubrobacteraceae bacterium]|nr:NUDIX domain-containing protein [Solirubrobacteraceae bacterium]